MSTDDQVGRWVRELHATRKAIKALQGVEKHLAGMIREALPEGGIRAGRLQAVVTPTRKFDEKLALGLVGDDQRLTAAVVHTETVRRVDRDALKAAAPHLWEAAHQYGTPQVRVGEVGDDG